MTDSPNPLLAAFRGIFESSCLPWALGSPWLYMLSDGVMGVAHLVMAWVLVAFARRRADLAALGWAFHLSALLIGLGGVAYLLEIPAYWHPDYRLLGFMKPLAAGAALATAILVGWLLFKLPEPSPQKSPDEIDQELNSVLEMHKRSEEERRKLSLAVEHSSSMVVIIDTAGRIEYCNPAFCKITGYSAKEMLGRRKSILKCGETDPEVYSELWGALSRGEPWQGELRERKKNGELFWCLKYVAPMRGEDGKVTHFVAVSHDVTESKASEETIRRLALYDPLTELPNRTLFRELLEQTQRYAKRDGEKFAVIYLDLDRFKNINDSLGHSEGDQLLTAVGKRLRRCLREGDTVARLSGDEFAIILPGLEHAKMAGAAAATILDAMNKPFDIAGHELFITASLGISVYPDDHSEIDQLLKMADAAMYQAKELGRNQYQYYHEMPRAVTVEHLSLETCLRFAVDRGELELHYQPKFELESERCFTAEALIRWRHPEMGMVSPGRFIPIAEETGLIGPIGEWVLRTVCRQIRKWQSQGLDLAVAVNLSARQFRQKNLLDRIDSIIEESGVDRARLEFEITESAVMSNPKQTAEILRGMKQRGLSLSIDDFGTGYSSLSYLKMFPVDILKIDQSFVRDIGTATGDPRIVKAIVALAHSLDLTVVAEGVETEAQMEFLKKLHCDLAQGYFYSRPLPPDELAALLRARSEAGRRSRVGAA
jgi:diguanylate cyclase (GGDEF)-like protein/PAS domain S-box-containing protein